MTEQSIYCDNCGNILDLSSTLDDLKESKQKGGKKKKKVATEKQDDSEEPEDEETEEPEESEEETETSSLERQQSQDDDTSTLIEKLLENKKVELPENFSPDNLRKSSGFRKLNTKEKEQVINAIQESLPKTKKKLFENIQVSDDVAYWICKGCGFHKTLESGTVIYSESINDQKELATREDYSNLVDDVTLPNTHVYTCINKKCPTQKDPKQKDAVFKRVGNTYQLVYVCKACKSFWFT